MLLPQSFNVDQNGLLKFKISDNLSGSKSEVFKTSNIQGMWFSDGGKKEDIKSLHSASAESFSRKLENNGLVLLSLDAVSTDGKISKEAFLNQTRLNASEQIIKNVEASTKAEFNLKTEIYSKTLLTSGKANGGLNDEKLGDKLEILLKQNPYKMKYGADVIALVIYEGKPIRNASVKLQTKASNGVIFDQNSRTDEDGMVYFKLNRSGIWKLTATEILPVNNNPDQDFQVIIANYLFEFRQ